jgi:hypothetical protein
MLARERGARIERMNEIDDMIQQELDLQNKFLDQFQTKANNDFSEMRGDLETEMDNRFKHQDQVVGDLSKFVKTFQDTLKVIGKDV